MKHCKNTSHSLNLLCILLCLLLSPIATHAHDFEVDGIYYKKSSNNSVSVTYKGNSYSGFNEYSGTVIIPESITYNDVTYSVTVIGARAFYGCTDLTSVFIGNSVTSIGDYAFYNCSGLTSLTIPNSVTSIGDYALSGCTGIKDLTIEDGEEILRIGESGEYRLLSDCPLEQLYLGRNLSYYRGYSPFYENSTLKSIIVSNSVTRIENYAFYGCSGLTSLTIPGSVTSIGISAFNGCTNLKELIFEDGEDNLSLSYNEYLGSGDGKGLFYDCPLENLYLGRNISYDPDSKYGYSPFYQSKTLKSVMISDLVTSIGKNAFSECSELNDVRLQSYVFDNIESSSFPTSKPIYLIPKSDGTFRGIENCNLTSYFYKISAIYEDQVYAVIKSSDALRFTNTHYQDETIVLVEYKECRAFSNIQSLKTIHQGKDISNDILSSDGYAFLPSANLEENTFYIYGTENDGELALNVILTEAGTLFDEVGLQNIEKVDVLKITGDINGTDVMAINRMTSLKYLDLSDANIIEGGITYRDNLKTSNDAVGSRFFNDVKLEALHLPNSVKTIESEALAGLSDLKVLVLGENVVSIGYYAFSDCSSLTTFKIPNSINFIDSYAFARCTGLKEFTIEDGEETLSLGYHGSGKGLFYDCPLENLYLGRNLYYDTVSKQGNSPFFKITTLKSLTIGNSVTTIRHSEFNGCTGLSNVNLGNSLELIDDYAFSGCTGLTTLSIPNSVIIIEDRAFYDCTGLETVIIGDSVTSIGNFVFHGCSSLTSLHIGNSVSTIGGCAFEKCSAISYLSIPDSVTQIGTTAFSGCSGLTSIYIGNSVSTIGQDAFNECSNLNAVNISDSDAWCAITFWSATSNPLYYAPNIYMNNELIEQVDFPDGIEKINDYVFYNYANLKSVSIPNSVTEIGQEAFYGTSLKEVLLPSAVTSVGYNAFGKCKSIEKVVSLNTTPPEIDSSTFDSEVEASATLHVQKGLLAYYWLDPVWKEFANITDDISTTDFDSVVEDFEDITVYNLDGTVIYTGSGSEVHLEKGFYLIQQCSKTFKIHVK